MKRIALIGIVLVSGLVSCVSAQTTPPAGEIGKPAGGPAATPDGKPAGTPAAKPDGKPAGTPADKGDRKPAGLPHLRIDKKNRTVEMDARVVLDEGMLELLVVITGGKDHEAILATDAKPSHLHAALLGLGLAPGRPARWARGVGGRGMFVPPAGARLRVSFRYTDAAGTVHTDPAHTWLMRREGQVPREQMEWVFVGSAVLGNGQYWADADGDVISVANFAAAVIDVPFHSGRGNDALEYTVNDGRVPAVGTAVTVVIKAVEGAEKAPVARAEFDVDRFGRYKLNGLAITSAEIEKWAPKFKEVHSHPYIVIRVAPRATMFDVERVKEILSLYQISDIDVFMRGMAGEMLPRTPEQARDKMKKWAEQFADYRALLLDPGDEAEVILKQLAFRRREVAALQVLWGAYEKQLTEALKAYREATKPVPPAGETDAADQAGETAAP